VLRNPIVTNIFDSSRYSLDGRGAILYSVLRTDTLNRMSQDIIINKKEVKITFSPDNIKLEFKKEDNR
jgi:hypothetical protein